LDLNIQATLGSEEVVTKKKFNEWKNTTKSKIETFEKEMDLLGSENKVLKNQLNESRNRESILNSTINDTGGKSMSLPN